ncbi:hypothetical protein PEE20_16180 [Salmonella enterica subsp. enterica serovar Bispebjerg]|uniref:hypothetical protein n=1 Tax=Salmonella enterica TaxID=28901 RepID=UPI0022E2EF0E|nr:hypothetical protein [Salmonella enterica]WBQ81096.1 hypothetical protein PEE20_16180 [Salmonella enterica subsp. enterica serovar Bispebjerg]
MIIPNTTTLGAQNGQPALNLADLIAGRFGLFHAKDAPECENLDTAMVGYMKITPDTKGNPQTGAMAYGNLQTWDSFGAGEDGQRIVNQTGVTKEWIAQILFMADGSLYTRNRINDGPYLPFIKRW